MAFNQKVKDQALEKSAFKCCICEKTSLSLEIHHIKPQAQGGSDTIDNAAPLCPNCHSDYGDNPKKMSIIKKKRDYWFDRVRKVSNFLEQDIKEVSKMFDSNGFITSREIETDSLIINKDSKDVRNYISFDYLLKTPESIQKMFTSLNNEYENGGIDDDEYAFKFSEIESQMNKELIHIFEEKSKSEASHLRNLRYSLLNDIKSIIGECRQKESWDNRSEIKLYSWLENHSEEELPLCNLYELFIIKENVQKYYEIHNYDDL